MEALRKGRDSRVQNLPQAKPPPVVTQSIQTVPLVDQPYLVHVNGTNFIPPFTGPQLASDGHPLLVLYWGYRRSVVIDLSAIFSWLACGC
jgi:hypothetical protein